MTEFYINIYQTPNGWQYISGTRFQTRSMSDLQPCHLLGLNLRRVFRLRVTLKVRS